jgi:hypothetical protein
VLKQILARRARQRTERRVTIKEEPSTSTSDAKIDSLVRTMERMMERLEITDRNPPRENQPGPQIRNPNFRRNPPQIRQREPRDKGNREVLINRLGHLFKKTMLMKGKR